MKHIAFILVIYLTISCNVENSKGNANQSKKQESKNEFMAEIKHIQDEVLPNKTVYSYEDVKKIHDVYKQSKYFEIRVASTLYLNNNKLPDETYDSYLERKIFYNKFIKEMFYFDEKLPENIKNIEENSLRYLNELRYIVKNMYEQYNGLTSKEFYTLLFLKDTFLIDIINDFEINKNVDSLERRVIIKDVEKYYPELLKEQK